VTIDRAGYPFIGGTAALALAAALTVGGVGAVPLLILAGFFTFFFRDPDRHSPTDQHLVLSPADGRVLVAGPANPDVAPAGPEPGSRLGPAGLKPGPTNLEPAGWQQISIFLSPMDVHVNYAPVAGRVTRVDFKKGKFLPAYHHDAAGQNERSEVWVDHHGQTVVFRQIVGILARRVVCRVKPGQELAPGQRFGIMKFGSRMDVFLPPGAKLSVSVGDKVVGGETVIAHL
jgi:phosphatidylserine decarboxylase